MAKTTITVDDIDGTKNAQSYRFALGNDVYTIDLSEKNYAKLEEALAPYIKAGAKEVSRLPRSDRGQRNSKEELQAMREWANANGYEVSDRGRVPFNVQEAYREANK